MKKIKNAFRYSVEFLSHAVNIAVMIGIFVPMTHLITFFYHPKNAIGIFIAGPLAGLANLLSNPKGLAAEIASILGIALSVVGFGVAMPSIYYVAAIGFSVNLLTSFVESVVIRIKNSHELNKSLIDNNNEGYGLHYIRRDIRERSPAIFGPLGKALFYNFIYANKFEGRGRMPYGAYEVYDIPEEIAGLSARKAQPFL